MVIFKKAFIGRALAQNSPMIILDEPTTHLDEENKIIILKLLRDLAKTTIKSFFSSHDWRLAKEFADKIWFINDQNLQEGLAEDILLKNDLLTNPRLLPSMKTLFHLKLLHHFRKEMLYSALQKNFKRDLSGFKIEFQGAFWRFFTKIIGFLVNLLTKYCYQLEITYNQRFSFEISHFQIFLLFLHNK